MVPMINAMGGYKLSNKILSDLASYIQKNIN
jgi:hypothetical protein